LLQKARNQGRRTALLDDDIPDEDEIPDDGTLEDHQMDKALSWLKAQYELRYMTVKRNTSNAVRSAFRTFLRQLIGDASIAYGILRHGCFSAPALRELIRETREKQENRARQKSRSQAQASSHRAITCDAPPDVTNPQQLMLAQTARAARQDFARGRKLAYIVEFGGRSHAQLNKDEQKLHQQFHSGQLERAMIDANQRCGEQAIRDDTDLARLWEVANNMT
jgi:hypothetical protein